MKILYITQLLPFPPDSGGRIKTLGTLKLLAKDHQVWLTAFVDDPKDLVHAEKLKQICAEVKVFYWPVVTQNHRELLFKMLQSLFTTQPFRVFKYFSPQMAKYLQDISAKVSFEAVHIDHLTMAQYLPFIKGQERLFKVYEEHNISSAALFGYFRLEKRPLEKWAYLLEAIKFYFYERSKIPLFAKVLAISRLDQERLVKMGIPAEKVSFLPLPMKVASVPRPRRKGREVLFIGLLSWWPNIDAINWFADKVLPLIWRKASQISFSVIGANASPDLRKKLACSRIKLYGYVPDVKPYFAKADVFVVPVRAGAGIRIKILTAMAAGVPVVATTKAAEGIEVKRGETILLADTPEEFAQAVMRVLTDKKLSQRLSQAGQKLIRETYSQEKATRVLKEITANKAP